MSLGRNCILTLALAASLPACVTARGATELSEMDDAQFSEWVIDSTEEIGLYADAAIYDGAITPEDLSAFVGALELGTVAQIKGEGLSALVLQQALLALKDELRRRGIAIAPGATGRALEYRDALVLRLKASIPAAE